MCSYIENSDNLLLKKDTMVSFLGSELSQVNIFFTEQLEIEKKNSFFDLDYTKAIDYLIEGRELFKKESSKLSNFNDISYSTFDKILVHYLIKNKNFSFANIEDGYARDMFMNKDNRGAFYSDKVSSLEKTIEFLDKLPGLTLRRCFLYNLVDHDPEKIYDNKIFTVFDLVKPPGRGSFDSNHINILIRSCSQSKSIEAGKRAEMLSAYFNHIPSDMIKTKLNFSLFNNAIDLEKLEEYVKAIPASNYDYQITIASIKKEIGKNKFLTDDEKKFILFSIFM